MMIHRRGLLTGAASAVLLGAGGLWQWRGGAAKAAGAESFEITRTEAEWRALLSEDAYAVLREEGTEPPYTSPLLEEKRVGTYNCAGCDLELYDAATKFDSGTGWPSFWEAIPGNVGSREDNSLFMARTEVHCRRCGGHQGGVFDDGPEPTGKRHCINGVALAFRPSGAA